jgi:poly-gamma-glutamate capsule biosynthesis protein CapA/YwtB (metallophosphatase superfamily)
LKSKLKTYFICGLLFVSALFIPGFAVREGMSLSELKSSALPYKTHDTLEVTLSFVGDIMGHLPLIQAHRQPDGNYDFTQVFNDLKDDFSRVDYTIGNLETVVGCFPYTGYPMFSSPEELAEACRLAGIDMMVTANNHTCDRNKKGINRTIDVLDSLGLAHTGSFKSQKSFEEEYPKYFEVKKVRFALLNYTYGTNGLPIPEGTIVNLLDSASIARDVTEARRSNVDFVIAFVHWGQEYSQQPNEFQIGYANWMYELGIDAIIGAHPHVVQPFEFLSMNTSRPIPVFYSLGNFISNQRERYENGGIVAEITFKKCNRTKFPCKTAYVPFYVNIDESSGKYQIVAEDSELLTSLNASGSKAYKQSISDSHRVIHSRPWEVSLPY